MFAVIKTGGKQYKVAADNEITVMALEGDAGAQVTFDDVLALFDGETSQIGAPHVAGARVLGEIVEQTRGPKVIAFKKRRRKNSRRKHGHKQDLTIVRITQIVADRRQGRAGRLAGAEGRPAGGRGRSRGMRVSSAGHLNYIRGKSALRERAAVDLERVIWLIRRQAVRRATAAIRTGAVSASRNSAANRSSAA